MNKGATFDPVPNTPGRQEIVDIYAKSYAALKDILVGEDFTRAAKRQAAQKMVEIQKHVKTLKRENAKWAERYIPKAYKNGYYQDNDLIKRYLGNDYTAQFSKLQREASMIVASGAVRDFNLVADALGNTFESYIEYSRYVGNKRFIAERIAGGIIEGQTRRTVSKHLLDDMKANIVDGNITVGKMTMNAKRYTDLLARTVSRAARTEGTINRLNQDGIDTVIISNTGAIDFCRMYEDQIFSISGKSKRFPKLTLRPPYHPNCTHTLSPFISEFADEGEVEIGSQFDKADSDLSSKEMARKYKPLKQVA